MLFISKFCIAFVVSLFGSVLSLPSFAKSAKFDTWKATHQKNYSTTALESAAKKIFYHNDDFITKHNLKGKSFSVGHNHFSDWTRADLRVMFPSNEHRRLEERSYIDYRFPKAPLSFDWRDLGAVNPVKDQGKCGSCWAFAANAAIESLYFIENHILPNFSEQQQIDCNHENAGCNGGTMDDAFTFVVDGLSEKAYYSGDCMNPSTKGITTFLKNPAYIDYNPGYSYLLTDNSLMAIVAYQGPTSVWFAVNFPEEVAGDERPMSDDAFMNYKLGIYDADNCNNINPNHFMVIIGYGGTGENGDELYWLIRNSWSSDWGIGGYVKVIRGKNMCNMNIGIMSPKGKESFKLDFARIVDDNVNSW